MKGQRQGKRSFSIAPLACMKRVKVTIDNLGPRNMKNNVDINFKSIFTEKAMNMRKNKEIVRSLKKDGCQAILQ